MKVKDFILQQIKKNSQIKSAEVMREFGITRQTAAQHFRELAAKKQITRLGTTLGARYVAYRRQNSAEDSTQIALTKKLAGLNEDRVFDEIDLQLRLKKILSPQAYKLCAYAFSEMLNNAIDHSGAKAAAIEFRLAGGNAEFLIKDAGVGVFESVRNSFKLKNHLEAAEHLMKGKQTTMPSRHSGQGIFFTSRAADYFSLESGEVKMIFDNRNQDVALEQPTKPVKGTWVYFSIKQKTRRDLGQLFRDYANDDFEFDKTEVRVRLSPKQGEHVSRSEARRILFGLDQFKRIVFDFSGVDGIGQAFADEVFRVFQRQHPNIKLLPENMNRAVDFMVSRALRETLQ